MANDLFLILFGVIVSGPIWMFIGHIWTRIAMRRREGTGTNGA